MIQERAIDSLYQRLGWRKPSIDKYDILDVNNLKSLSGKYFDDFNVLTSIKNLKDTQENAGINERDFNEYLKALQYKSIRFVLENVFDNKVYENTSILANSVKNDGTISLDTNTFYGVEIDLMKSREIALKINQIGLFFDSSGSFDLHLFHSGNNAPIKSWAVTTVSKTEVFTDINEVLYAYSKNIKGGKYFLGFRSVDVVGSPINRQELIRQSCFVGIEFIRVPMTSLEMFNTDDVIYTSDEYLNIDYLVETDYTELIVGNSNSFDFAIGLQQSVNVLEQISNTTRSNSTERNLSAIRVEAFLELNGNDTNPNLPFKVGITSKLNDEINKLKQRFNRRCRASVGTLTV